MKLSLLLTICLFTGLLASAQQLTIPELVKLRYQTVAQMEAALKEKGYTVVQDTKDPGWRLLMFSSIVTENDKPVMRNVMISQVFDPVILEIHYRFFVKAEIDALRDWLFKNGYKKGETYDFGEGPSTGYTKAGKTITIQVVNNKNSATVPVAYEVSINNKDYK